MSATLDIPALELAKLPTALRAIAGAAGRAAEEILRGEAGIILKACAGATKVAPRPAADLRSQLRLLRELGLTGNAKGRRELESLAVTINAGVKAPFGRVFLGTLTGRWRRTHEANFRRVAGMPSRGRRRRGDHYADDDWILLLSAIQHVRQGLGLARQAGRKTIGLARQAWVQIADSLGIPLETVRGGGALSSTAIAKARGALTYRGKHYKNGVGTREQRATSTRLTLINRYPRGRALGMDKTLARVLTGRIRYFEQNLQRGVFNSIAATARAYPYLRVTEASA